MINEPNIKELLNKFVLGQCSAEETAKVVAYCRDNNLTDAFPTVDEVQALLQQPPQMDDETANRIFASITSPKATVAHRLPVRRYIAIAASFILLCTAGWFYLNEAPAAKKAPKLTGNEITLQLENGDVQVIAEDGTSQVVDTHGNVVAQQSKGSIVYGDDTETDKLVYNTIKIPYGKRFQLKLSDGTLVHLNSGTSLKYPVNFIAGEQNRMVYLDGEAFFEVAKNKEHPFIVNADNLDVRVLGTHFNVSSYPEDDVADVVLVEGSVGMYKTGQPFDASRHTILKPGEKGSFTKGSSAISTRSVTTSIYTSWINGELVFRNMAFKNIVKKLERHYDITIENHNVALASEKFNASFKNEKVENILSYFTEVHPFKYLISKNKIIIN